jgi:glycosyltransferase involved in cell wall biosynthesis
VVVIIPALMPSVVIGALRPLSAIEREGGIQLRVRKANDWTIPDINWCDVVVFYRNQEKADLDALYAARSVGKAVVYEIDDNFFEISLGLPLGRWHRDPTRLHALKRFMQMSHLVRVYSEALRDQAEQFAPEVDLIRSYFDRDLIKNVRQRARQADGPVRIAYATGRSADPALERAMMGALERVSTAFGPKVEISFWRKPPSNLAKRANIKVMKPLPNYDQFVHSFYRTGFDIGVAPVLDDVFHNSKTNNKYREYGGCGVAGIYSNVQLYRACVKQGENGLLADNTADSWYGCLASLISEKELRTNIAKQAQEDVFRHYSFENAVADWQRHLASLVPIYSSAREREGKAV